MGHVKAEAVVDTLADTLTKSKAETLSYTRGDVDDRNPCRYAD